MNKKLDKLIRKEVSFLRGESLKKPIRKPSLFADDIRLKHLIEKALREYEASPDGKDFPKMIKEALSQFNQYLNDFNQKGNADLAKKLRDYRADHRMSQDALASKLGCGRRQIIRWEAGMNKPNNMAIRRMEEIGIL